MVSEAHCLALKESANMNKRSYSCSAENKQGFHVESTRNLYGSKHSINVTIGNSVPNKLESPGELPEHVSNSPES